MAAKSARLAVKRELQRASNNIEWCGRHLMQVHHRCALAENEQMTDMAEALILLAQEFKRNVDAFEKRF